jgi:hypothetical protein
MSKKLTKTVDPLPPTIDAKIAALRATRETVNQACEQALAAWFKQAFKICKAANMMSGLAEYRLNRMHLKRGAAGTMLECVKNYGTDVSPLIKLKEKDLLKWSFEEGIIKFADYFSRLDRNIVAIAQSRLDEAAALA